MREAQNPGSMRCIRPPIRPLAEPPPFEQDRRQSFYRFGMRLIAALLVIATSSCALQERQGVSKDNCLTGETRNWTRLAAAPENASTLISLAESAFPNEPDSFEEHWYADGQGLLYCRREDWCVSESWTYSRRETDWQVVGRNSLICVTSHNHELEPTLLRAPA